MFYGTLISQIPSSTRSAAILLMLMLMIMIVFCLVIPSRADRENTPCREAGGWTALLVWKTRERLGKARIKPPPTRAESHECSLWQLITHPHRPAEHPRSGSGA